MNIDNIDLQMYTLHLIANHEEMTPKEQREGGLIWIDELHCYFSPEDIATAATTTSAKYSTIRKVLQARTEKRKA